MAQSFRVLALVLLMCYFRLTNEKRAREKRDVDELDCEFGKGEDLTLCGWTSSNMSILQWQTGNSKTAFWLGGPRLDHAATDTGGYVFVDTSTNISPSSLLSKQTAILESPLQEPTSPQGTCIQFWYNIQGLSPDSLRLLLFPDDPSLPSSMGQFTLWEEKDCTVNVGKSDMTDTSDWHNAKLSYAYPFKHKLVFEAQSKITSDPASAYRGFIALDDIEGANIAKVTSSACAGFCSFEGGMCEWITDPDQVNTDFEWELSRGSASHLTGPARDHGSQLQGGNAGGFAYIDTSNPRRPGDRARLVSSMMDATTDSDPVCIRFFTHMYGSGVGSLKIIILMRNQETLLWMVTGDAGNQWHMGQTTITASEPFQIIFEGTVGRNPIGNIAVDDITFQSGPCPAMPPTAVIRQADCTFETDECNWVNVNRPDQDQIDWQRVSPLQMSGGPPPPNIPIVVRRMEPSVDHTTGSPEGYYLQMERGNSPARNGDRAMLVSPTFKQSSKACLSFWVALHERTIDSSGPGLGTLRVYIRPSTALVIGPIGYPRWRLTNYEASNWFFARVPIEHEESSYKVIIEGTWGSARQGTIAIDDITVYDDENCKAIPKAAEVSAGECSFDRDTCEWMSSQNNITTLQNQWQLATPLRRPNNINDHTYLAPVGYAYFDIYNPSNPVSVRLESPEIQISQATEKCITFWFLGIGSAADTQLKILVGESDNGRLSNEEEIWSIFLTEISGSRSEWKYAQTSFHISDVSKIIFEGVSSNGGFAIDDINIYEGACPSRPVTVRRNDSGSKVRTRTSPKSPKTEKTTVEVPSPTTSPGTDSITQPNTSTNPEDESGP